MPTPTLSQRASTWLNSEPRALMVIKDAFNAMQAKIDAETVADISEAEATLEVLATGYVSAGGQLDDLLSEPTQPSAVRGQADTTSRPALDTSPLIADGVPEVLNADEKRARFQQLKCQFGNSLGRTE